MARLDLAPSRTYVQLELELGMHPWKNRPPRRNESECRCRGSVPFHGLDGRVSCVQCGRAVE
jgi:hypothetical protein